LQNADIYNEKLILLRISEGDEAAFRVLYDHHSRKVYFISRRLLKSEVQAEDIVQEIFSKVWFNREKLPDVERFSSWLNSIVRNHIFNHLRKKANEETFIIESLRRENDLSEDSEFDDNMKMFTELLYQAVNELPAQQKKVFQMGRRKGLNTGKSLKS